MLPGTGKMGYLDRDFDLQETDRVVFGYRNPRGIGTGICRTRE